MRSVNAVPDGIKARIITRVVVGGKYFSKQ